MLVRKPGDRRGRQVVSAVGRSKSGDRRNLWGMLASVAAPFIGGMISDAFGGGGRRRGGGGSSWLRAADEQTRAMGARATQADNAFWQASMGFDPEVAARSAASAQANLVMPQIRQALTDLRGSQVGSGRLRTGFGMGDQDQFLTNAVGNLNDQLAARAMQAAQMRQQQIAGLGDYAMNTRSMFMDAALGRHYSEEDRRAAEAASRRGMWGNLIGSAIPSIIERAWN